MRQYSRVRDALLLLLYQQGGLWAALFDLTPGGIRADCNLLLHLHPHLLPIYSDLYPTVLICSQQGVTLNRFQGFGRKQAFAVAGGDAEQHHLRVQLLNPFRWVDRGETTAGQLLDGHRG